MGLARWAETGLRHEVRALSDFALYQQLVHLLLVTDHVIQAAASVRYRLLIEEAQRRLREGDETDG